MILRDLGAAFPADHREEEDQVGDPPLPVAPGDGGPEVPEHQLPADDIPEQGGQRPGTLGPAGSRHGIHPAQAQPVAQAGEAGVDHQRGVARPPTQRETAAAAGRRPLRAPAQQQVREAALLAGTRGPILEVFRMRHGNTGTQHTWEHTPTSEPGSPGLEQDTNQYTHFMEAQDSLLGESTGRTDSRAVQPPTSGLELRLTSWSAHSWRARAIALWRCTGCDTGKRPNPKETDTSESTSLEQEREHTIG